jgi:hypothetical protein
MDVDEPRGSKVPPWLDSLSLHLLLVSCFSPQTTDNPLHTLNIDARKANTREPHKLLLCPHSLIGKLMQVVNQISWFKISPNRAKPRFKGYLTNLSFLQQLSA